MKALYLLAVIASLVVTNSIAQLATHPNMIGWMRGDDINGGEQIILFPDGRVRISILRYGDPKKPNPGWNAERNEDGTCYRSDTYLSRAEVKQLYKAAMAAGVKDVKSFPNPMGDAPVEIVITTDALARTIPEFYGEGEEDHNIGSKNHKRFLAVKKIMDQILDESVTAYGE